MSKRGGGGRGRGGKRSQKGRNRQFTSPEEMERQLKEERESWRTKKEEGSGDEESVPRQVKDDDDDDSDSETDSSSDEESGKAKGVSHLIEIQNPNRVVKKSTKATNVDLERSGTEALTRREREQVEKEQARQWYMKLHAEGKTTEAQGDLARLALIRKQREEASKKRDAEKKEKEAAAARARKK